MPSPHPTASAGAFFVSMLLALAIAGCGVAPAGSLGARLRATDAEARGFDGFMRDVFKAADANGDGALTPAESGLLAQQFASFDRDGDNRLTSAEWAGKGTDAQVARALPAFLPFVLDLHRQLDVDSNRLVTLSEVQTAAEGPSARALLQPEAMKAAFRTSDRDRSAALDGTEFESFYLRAADSVKAQGFGKRLAWRLLGTYVALTSRIAAQVAINAARLPIRETPAKFGIPFETVSLRASDGLNLKAWYVPAKVKTDKAIILLHGRSDSREMFIRQRQIEWLHPHYNLLAIDLRNHGESEGEATTFAFHEYLDAQAGLAFLKARGHKRFAAYGISLGGAVALHAAEHSPEIEAVVEDCTYATVVSAFKGFVSFMFVPSPVLVAAAAVTHVNHALNIDMIESEPLRTASKLGSRPLLVIHGGEDQYITPENGRIIHAVATGPKEIMIVPGAQHAVSAEQAPGAYREKLLGFLKRQF